MKFLSELLGGRQARGPGAGGGVSNWGGAPEWGTGISRENMVKLLSELLEGVLRRGGGGAPGHGRGVVMENNSG